MEPRFLPEKIRNIAIIAHVDHGKTTLVDAFLKQSHVFRENQSEMQQEQILDRNDLERERGITITAKNTAVEYNGYKINIIDTPGHADFGGEVERTLNMADGCILLIDAQEGPMPQTRFVLKKALELGKKILVVVNKIDKTHADVDKILKKTYDLFLELATLEEQLEFPIFYAIAKDGKVFSTLPTRDHFEDPADLSPLFEAIISYFHAPIVDREKPLQLLVTALDYDNYLGTYAIGRVVRGDIQSGQSVYQIHQDGSRASFKISKLFVSKGLSKEEVSIASGGDIVAITGAKDVKINDTITDVSTPELLSPVTTQEPSVKIKFESNTSPFLGKEGKFVTARQIEERLKKEMESNVSMRFENMGGGAYYVSGRGELHLAILIETMRREGYEFQLSRPEAIIKVIDGKEYEPLEEVIIDVAEEYMGAVTNELGRRKAELIDIVNEGNGSVRLSYRMLTKNLLGLRNELINQTRGTAVINNFFLEYVSKQPSISKLRKGVIISSETGVAMAYALESAQERGNLFISPGESVYEGMVVGINKYDQDMEFNVCRERHKTGVRSAFVEIDTPLTPPIPLTLEFCLTFLEPDELLEVTPKSLRLRKKYLAKKDREVAGRQ